METTANDLTRLIEQAQRLPEQQKLALIAAISSEMAADSRLQDASRRFWKSRSLQQHLDSNPVEPAVSVDQLRSRAWAGEDDLEAFLEFSKIQRQTALAEEKP